IFIGAFFVNVTTAGNVVTSLAIASGNTLEALCGAWLVNRFAGGTTVFDRPQAVFTFALAAAVSTIIGPAFGVTSLALAGFADWGTLHGFGPFLRETENQSLLTLQSWTAVLTITAMALSAGMAERRRAEEALQQQNAAVEAANRTKDHFLAMLSHELRTPLTPVISALEALETEPAQTREVKSALAMIRRNVELETQLIDDLLDFTRIAKDKLQLRFAPVDAHAAISDVVEMCRAEAESRKLQVHLNLRANTHYV